MTSDRNAAKWQDVYDLPFEGEVYYVKFRDDIVLRFMLLSFKDY